MGFKNDFVWGGATASYQIEGAAYEDGKGLSIWDVFTHEKNRIYDGRTGDIACDHYHLYQKDVDLMKEIGFTGYRFSICWPRIIPGGIGAVNEKGLDFYERLLDALLKAGITPFATLYHWDYPYSLHLKGGWLNNDSSEWFAEYASLVGKRYGDRLKNIITFNEPQCLIGLSYSDTDNAPGIHYPLRDTLRMGHNVLLSHGKAVKALRSLISGVNIGISPTAPVSCPITDNADDREAARKSYFYIGENQKSIHYSVAYWSDPVFLGQYPKELYDNFDSLMGFVKAEDLKIISEPVDFLGQNIYQGYPVKSDGKGGWERVQHRPGYPFTGNKWPVTPECLYWGPVFLSERYKKPVYITENGLALADVVSLDGKVHDPNRIDFLHRYLRELRRAAESGVDIRGYFHWTVTDNFEWDMGFTQRMGLIFCDYETQERIVKDSAWWYRDVIHANGNNL
jgi:beta-glucosidase